MRSDPEIVPGRGRDERAAGREDPLSELRARLAAAPPDYLEGALDNPHLTHREVVSLLRNRQAAQTSLARIAGDGKWLRYYEVKRGLALHPATPQARLRNLLPHLYWKELVEIASGPHVNPLARRQAEKLLSVRSQELSEGERIALARRATRGVFGALLESTEVSVLKALAGNPRAVEADAVRIASRPSTPAVALAHLAQHPRWGCRRAVRIALAGNPTTPVAVALRLIHEFPGRDLQRLAGDSATPRIVRVGAGRLLDRRRARRPSNAPRRYGDG